MANLGRVRLSGVACAFGGALWVVALLAGVFAHDAIYGDAASYRAWEGLLIVTQALLLVGVLGLAGSGAAGDGWLGRLGLGIAILGRVAFVIGECRSLIQGRDDEVFVPLGALLTGLGMLLAGIGIVRVRRWGGWHRAIPLLTGVYPFVAMFPFFVLTDTPPAAAIALWGPLWLALGLALRDEASGRELAGSGAALAA